MKTFTILSALAGLATAFPNMAAMMNLDENVVKRAIADSKLNKRQASSSAAPGSFTTDEYPFVAPGSGDIRGPCPGLNAMANHGVIPHNGIATYAQLVQGQQVMYNVGDDLANLLCLVAIPLDGDLVTLKLSIGQEATSQTAALGAIQNYLGKEAGLDGHNTFEADTSLTRNDYFLADGDNHSFNGTLFKEMYNYCQSTSSASAPLFDRTCMTGYRAQRYQESLSTNGQFFFGPLSLLLYGASSFLYELMPNNGGSPDLATITSFFGATTSDNGETWTFNNEERAPDGWIPRQSTPYSNELVTDEILAQYLGAPVLFGGNVGVNNFDSLNLGSYISDGKLNTESASDIECLLWQLATSSFPTSLSQVVCKPAATLTFVLNKAAPFISSMTCPSTDTTQCTSSDANQS